MPEPTLAIPVPSEDPKKKETKEVGDEKAKPKDDKETEDLVRH